MKRVRRKFTDEFKSEAVRLVHRGDRPASVIARELGLNAELLRTWVRLAAPVPSEVPESLEAENRRLRRELTRASEERDLLKKATVGSTGECNMLVRVHSLEVVTCWKREARRIVVGSFP